MAVPIDHARAEQNWAVEYSIPAQAVCLVPLLGSVFNIFCQMEVVSEFSTAYEAGQIDRVIELIELKNTYKYVAIAHAVVASALIVASVVAGLASSTNFFIAAPVLIGVSLYSNIPGISENNEHIETINQSRSYNDGMRALPLMPPLQ